MPAADVPPSLELLSAATTTESHIYALKQLKNDIIGHERRKAALIKSGIVEHLVTSLASRSTGKQKSAQQGSQTSGADGGEIASSEEWTEDHQLRLQSVYIVTSLAHGMLHHPLHHFAQNCWQIITRELPSTVEFVKHICIRGALWRQTIHVAVVLAW